MDDKVDLLILGSGVAGLSAAERARANARSVKIFEAERYAGGLLAPIVIDGFTFDTAVHLSFASEPEVRKVFDQTPYITHKPESLCWDDGTWLKHPVQNNLYPLKASEKVELIAGLAESTPGHIENYRDWLLQQYGAPIAERWPLAYTKKYWSVPADELGTDWVGQRMRKADLREVISGALNETTPNHYYVKEMRYPENGGYQSFIRPLIERADILYGHRAIGLDQVAKRVSFDNGSTVSFSTIISTIPLPDIVGMMNEVPREISEAAETLFATSMDLISVGFKRPNVSPALWFYIYDSDILAARAYSPDWKSPNNVPEGCSALQFEIYSSRKSGKLFTVAEMKENVAYAIGKMGLASRDDILFMHHTYKTHANVVFDRGMEARRDTAKNWVRSQGVNLAGRFGEWDYLWSNQAFMSGFNAAELIS